MNCKGQRATSTAAFINRPTPAIRGSASTASIRGQCTTARFASIPATTITSSCSARRSTARRTAARRSPLTADAAFTSTITPCGSIHATGGTSFSATTADSTSRTTAWTIGTTITTSRLGSSTTSASDRAATIASTAACKTTGAGADRAALVRTAGRSTRIGFASAAAMGSSSASIRMMPTRSTSRVRTAAWAASISGPASAASFDRGRKALAAAVRALRHAAGEAVRSVADRAVPAVRRANAIASTGRRRSFFPRTIRRSTTPRATTFFVRSRKATI